MYSFRIGEQLANVSLDAVVILRAKVKLHVKNMHLFTCIVTLKDTCEGCDFCQPLPSQVPGWSHALASGHMYP